MTVPPARATLRARTEAPLPLCPATLADEPGGEGAAAYWLADGFHRTAAAKSAGLAEIDADVRQGTRRDAILFSVGANAAHGLRRTNADKRRAVETLLRDEEWVRESVNWIAKTARVSRDLVERTMEHLQISKSPTRSTSDGRVMNTANIGRKPATGAPSLRDVTRGFL